jgi:hypothetical protein
MVAACTIAVSMAIRNLRDPRRRDILHLSLDH